MRWSRARSRPLSEQRPASSLPTRASALPPRCGAVNDAAYFHGTVLCVLTAEYTKVEAVTQQ